MSLDNNIVDVLHKIVNRSMEKVKECQSSRFAAPILKQYYRKHGFFPLKSTKLIKFFYLHLSTSKTKIRLENLKITYTD